jgi:hypothetical protein
MNKDDHIDELVKRFMRIKRKKFLRKLVFKKQPLLK